MTKNRTKTQSFGVSKREGHDATQFYTSRLYEGILQEKKKIKIIDNSSKITKNFYGKAKKIENLLETLPDVSIHLIFYIIPKLFNEDIDKYLEKLQKFIPKLKSLLINGGRLILIIQNEYEKKFFPLHSFIVPLIISEEFLMRGEVILSLKKDISEKKNIENNYHHGYIFSKNLYGRKKKDKKQGKQLTDTIERDDFIQFTKSIWSSQNTKNVFLFSIPRFLELYSFKEDSIIILSDENPIKIDTLVGKIRKKRIIGTLDSN